MNIINLTSHAVSLWKGETIFCTFPPSGRVLRLYDQIQGEASVIEEGIPVWDVSYSGHFSEAPNSHTVYIVPFAVANFFKRIDFIYPYDVVRAAKGVVIGCRSFARVVNLD